LTTAKQLCYIEWWGIKMRHDFSHFSERNLLVITIRYLSRVFALTYSLTHSCCAGCCKSSLYFFHKTGNLNPRTVAIICTILNVLFTINLVSGVIKIFKKMFLIVSSGLFSDYFLRTIHHTLLKVLHLILWTVTLATPSCTNRP